MKRKSSDLINVLLVLMLLVGLSLLLYPSVSDYWNTFHQSRAIAEYAEQVVCLDKSQYQKICSNKPSNIAITISAFV
ncbi:MAG: hypothetical protein ACI4II_02790 [Acutalibacteraceae bacterium]